MCHIWLHPNWPEDAESIDTNHPGIRTRGHHAMRPDYESLVMDRIVCRQVDFLQGRYTFAYRHHQIRANVSEAALIICPKGLH